MSAPTPCRIDEPDGTPLASGTAELEPSTATARIVALDRPGQLVQRCLLGGLRRVRLHLGDGACAPAEIERVFFDPAAGRCCTVRLGEATGLSA